MLKTPVALITGASRGIGAATARKLAANGYAICLNYNHNREKAETLAGEIIARGGKALAVKADMGVEADVMRMFEVVDSEFGGLSALVNNAVAQHTQTVEMTSMAVLEETYRVNVFGTIIACREAVRRMKAAGGAIVNMSSEAARFGGNRMTAYASSKAAINTFTIGFAREVAPYGIRVNVVSPGIIDTDAHKAAPADRLAGLAASIPMGRMGSPEEAAATVAWLLSSEASYISGSILSVTGAR